LETSHFSIPPNAAANPLAPIAGRILPNVGARTPIPCAIAGAARPVKNKIISKKNYNSSCYHKLVLKKRYLILIY
jgi:hypothetical protein